jgi:hypothetical protein
VTSGVRPARKEVRGSMTKKKATKKAAKKKK